MNTKLLLVNIASAGIGVGVSTGYPIGIAAAIVMPPLALSRATRRDAYLAACCYYAGALWPIIPAACNFFGPSASFMEGVVAWLTSALLLAMPWLVAWTERRVQLLWRVPFALLVTVVPPLGFIGWASPLTATGFIFPGAGWIGLLTLPILCGALSVAPKGRGGSCIRVSAATIGVMFALIAHRTDPGNRIAPLDWEGVNTTFGSIGHGRLAPVSEYGAAQWIQERAASSDAHVIIFPETVVPSWTDATDLFWQQTLVNLPANGKTILVGAGVPDSSSGMKGLRPALGSYDFSAAAAMLRSGYGQSYLNTPPTVREQEAYRNAVVIRGAEHGTFFQRIPVPLGMWHPFGTGGVPLNLSGPGVVPIGKQRAAILICYEQLLTWPVLVSILERPTIIVAVANDCWVERTPIPRYQANAVRAWARLFAISSISAVNR